jgi:hypothetical protein
MPLVVGIMAKGITRIRACIRGLILVMPTAKGITLHGVKIDNF